MTGLIFSGVLRRTWPASDRLRSSTIQRREVKQGIPIPA